MADVLIKEMILLFIVITIGIFQMIEGAFFHELGHLTEMRKYKYTKAEIKLKFACALFKVKDCKFTKDIHMKSEGDIEPEISFLNYSEDELKIIAKAGVKAANDFVLIIGLISITLIYAVGNLIKVEVCTNGENSLETLFIGDPTFMLYLIVISFVLTITSMLGNVMKYNKKNFWGDKEIEEDPSGFRKYVEGIEKNGKSADTE